MNQLETTGNQKGLTIQLRGVTEGCTGGRLDLAKASWIYLVIVPRQILRSHRCNMAACVAEHETVEGIRKSACEIRESFVTGGCQFFHTVPYCRISLASKYGDYDKVFMPDDPTSRMSTTERG